MKKALALDLDGTVLNQSGQLTEEVRQALIKAKDKGLQLIFCTGRPFSGTAPILEAVGLPAEAYVVTNNGSCIESVAAGILYKSFLTVHDYEKISRFCNQHQLSVIAVSEKFTYSYQLTIHNEVLRFCQLTGSQLIIQPIDTHSSKIEFFKLMICDEPEKILRIKKLLFKQFGSCYQCVQSEASYLEILPKGVNKGSALEKIAEIYQLEPSDIIAIGDNENDLSMLKYSGTAIVMENGIKTVKRHADWICPSNEENGVAKAVEWIVKNMN